MPLPTINIGFSTINSEMGRTSNQQYDFNDSEGRKLASAGNTGQNLSPNTEIRLSRFRGHARTKITLSSNENEVNLLSKAQAVNYATGATYASYTVNAGTIIGANTSANQAIKAAPAMLAGAFTSGDLIEVTNDGYIVGAGGRGGDGANEYGSPQPGQPGGDAFFTRYPLTLTNNGSIWGGGGGGGGGYQKPAGTFSNSGGGGGGGGGGGTSSTPSQGGPGGSGGIANRNGAPGAAGTFSSGGVGGGGYGSSGGGGGNVGNNGSAEGLGINPGGVAGNAIDGNSSINGGGGVGGSVIGPVV